MYLKLALRNIRRSVRDYAIYFITLLFGVAVFYAFNSIGSQQILFDMEASADARMFDATAQMLGMFSVVVACVLGFLILYANQFLIRRRKREFGTYLVLGMTPGHVSRIVLYETVLVGLLSLIVGLICGVLLSQGLSFVTASLFGATMSNYQFVFSPDALVVTLACFAAIYVVVALFNTVSVSRCKLIDLIRAGEKNERAGVRNPWVCLVAFVVSIAILAYAYQQLIANGLVMLDAPEFLRATIGMLVGTLLFFWSLAGFAIAVLTRLRGVDLRKLNLFTVRQIASKVNTAFLSLWAVCVLLFFSITVFSSGMGLVEVFVGGVEKANPYSASLSAGVWYGPDGTPESSAGLRERRAEMEADAPERLADPRFVEFAAEAAIPFVAVDEAHCVSQWGQDFRPSYLRIREFVDSLPRRPVLAPLIAAAETVASAEAMRLDDLGRVRDTNLGVIALSDFNGIRAVQGQEPLALEPGTCLMANNMDMIAPLAQAIAKAAPSVNIEGHELAIVGPVCDDTQVEDNVMAATSLALIVPDEVVEALEAEGCIPDRQILNVQYADNGQSAAENDDALEAIVAAAQPLEMGGFEKGTAGAGDAYASLLWPVSRILTAHEMIAQSAGLKLMITYLALYIGFIFLVSTAAILAIQQLSQASDSAPRYRILWKLGCDAGMIYRSLLIQVLVYFLVPLGLALCHSVCAVGVLSDSMLSAIGTNTFGPIMMAAVLLLVIYGGYLLVPYFAARGIVKGALAEG